MCLAPHPTHFPPTDPIPASHASKQSAALSYSWRCAVVGISALNVFWTIRTGGVAAGRWLGSSLLLYTEYIHIHSIATSIWIDRQCVFFCVWNEFQSETESIYFWAYYSSVLVLVKWQCARIDCAQFNAELKLFLARKWCECALQSRFWRPLSGFYAWCKCNCGVWYSWVGQTTSRICAILMKRNWFKYNSCLNKENLK